MRRTFFAALLVVAVGAGVIVGCGGRPVVQPPPDDLGVVAGRVIKGPVQASTVTVYRLDGVKRGAAVGTATTDVDGSFRVAVGTATGPFLVVATAGNFIDEATGVTVQLSSAELTALVPVFDVETKLETLRITPVSHLAAGLALRWVVAGANLGAADAEAWQHLNAHFGALNWRSVTPTDVTATPGATLDEPARAGLLLAALSMEARLMAEGAGLTPGGRVQSLTLTEALYDDVTADGFFDGVGAAGRLVLPSGGTVADAGPSATTLDGQTARTALAQAVAKFLVSDRNVTTIKLADAQQLVTAIATNADERIFRGTSGPADVEAPVIVWVKPAQDMAGVHGTVELEVRATDNVGLKSFAFAAPASLVATIASPTPDGKTSTLRASLDVSSLADGPVQLVVKAIDTSNNEASKPLTIVVSNHGPTITVAAPSEGATLKGLVAINATATAQAGSISKLELRMPPGGVSADSLPAAGAFGATWNTLQSQEGMVSLTFHAEDTLGGVADTTVTVNVDNVPFGQVTAAVSGGAPVDGLIVKLVAIDDSTGLPVAGRAGGAVLGTSTAETVDGGVSFLLTQENYEGPVQVVAQGASATYVDPSEDSTLITLPSTFTFTSFVSNYRSGDALTVPVTLWTSLADAAAVAYAQGRNPSHTSASSLKQSLAVIDPLFSAHVTTVPWNVRTTTPVRLTTTPQALRDVVYAAFSDVALNRLARDLAADVGLTPGTGFNAPLLVDLLRRDLADGQFDGRQLGVQLQTAGSAPYALDANTTRLKQALALDAFVRSPANRTGLARVDLQTTVSDVISNDTSLLYPASVPPIPFDNQPPVLTREETFTNGGRASQAPVGASKLVGGVLSMELSATDFSGLASLSVVVNGTLPVTPTVVPTASRFVGTFDTTSLSDGPATVSVRACDRIANCATTDTVFLVDNTTPIITSVAPVAGYYSTSLPVDASATDANGVASLEVQGLSGITDTDASPSRFVGAWTVTGADAPLPASLRSCDVVNNCRTATLAGLNIDRTPPRATWRTTPAARVSQPVVLVTVDATDMGAGVSGVMVQGAGSPVPAARQGTSWVASISLEASGTPTTVTAWAVDNAISPNSGQGRGAPFEATTTVTYDNNPPVVTWTVAYTNGPRVGASPVGAARLVAGALSLVADAADLAGVTSVVVTAASSSVSPGMGATASHFVGAFASTAVPDGPLNLVARSCDGLGNCGDTPLVLMVDNHAPAIAVASPTAQSYSAPPDLDATASDPAGVADFTVSSSAAAAGSVVDRDLAVGHVYAPGSSWSIPAATTDGPMGVTFVATDAVGNVATTPTNSMLDRTAPATSLAVAPPAFSSNPSAIVLFISSADSGAGVGVVRARVQGSTQGAVVATPAAGQPGRWTASGLQLVPGANTILVWAEDTAVPPNSGESRGAPFSATSVVVVDTTPPSPTLAPRVTFWDEDVLSVVTDSNGVPVVPIQYVPMGAGGRTVDTSGLTIKRAATRVTSTVEQPVLSYRVPVSSSEAPIVAATWRTDLPRCPYGQTQCIPSTISGSLTSISPPPGALPNNVYFDLPLALPMDGTYVLTLSFRDAAGNTGSTTFNIVWRLVGPPLVVIPDVAWEAANDPQAVHSMRLGDASYGYLYGFPGRTLLQGKARMRRYLVYNPAPTPVAVAVNVTSAVRSGMEQWQDIVGSLYGAEGAGLYQVDNFDFARDYVLTGNNQYPCRFDLSYPGVRQYVRHVRGSPQVYECFGDYWNNGPVDGSQANRPRTGGWSFSAPTSDTTVAWQWASNPAPLGTGNEVTTAGRALLGSSGAVVPAASATAPGVIALYVAVSVGPNAVPMTSGALPHLADPGVYKYYYADFWSAMDDYPPVPPQVSAAAPAAAQYWYRELRTASTSVDVTYDVLSSAIDGYGEDLSGSFADTRSTPRTLVSGRNDRRTVTH